MAFSLNYLNKVGSSHQLDPTYNSNTGDAVGVGPNLWTYQGAAAYANNSTAEIIAANYFDGASGYLEVGDIIFANSNTPAGLMIRVATNSAGAVTTTQVV
jgi:hypothetical protein